MTQTVPARGVQRKERTEEMGGRWAPSAVASAMPGM